MIWHVSVGMAILWLSGSYGQVEASDSSLPNSVGLSLFMTLPEQKILEQNQVASFTLEHDELTAQDGEETISGSLIADPIEHTAKSIRYDGVILKSGKMIDVWLDGKRVLNTDDYADVALNEVNSTGQLSLTVGERSVKLFPGDSYPSDDITTENVIKPSAIESKEPDATGAGIESAGIAAEREVQGSALK